MVMTEAVNKTNYDLDYFIEKFSHIPDDRWTTCKFVSEDKSQCCALGHCGAKLNDDDNTNEIYTIESLALIKLEGELSITDINDGAAKEYPQKTPKARILAYLQDLKESNND